MLRPSLTYSPLILLLLSCGGDSTAPPDGEPAVASVTVIPSEASIIVHGTAQFRAEVRDSAGNLLTGRTVVWSAPETPSPTPPKITVDQTGLVTAVSRGVLINPETRVTATLDGVSDSARIFVVIGPLFRISLAPAAVTTIPEGSVQLLAKALDSLGNGVPNTVLSWSVADPATVVPAAPGTDANGEVSATVTMPTAATVTVEVAAGEVSASAVVAAAPASFASVSAGDDVSCGLTGGGEALCWGSNLAGSLGAGFYSTANLPIRVAGSHAFTKIAAGYTTCGLTAAGVTYCWGVVGNSLFEADTVAEVDRYARPVPAALGFTFADITVASPSHVCGLTTAGQANCWGTMRYLGSGSDTNTDSPDPVPVAGGLAFTSLSAGQLFTCGTIASGTAYCWGENQLGELGNGDTTVRYAATPVAVTGGLAFTQVTVGALHACGLTTSGAAYCWGGNVSGELGSSSTEICVPQLGSSEPGGFVPCSSSPLAVPGGLMFTAIGASGSQSCGLATNGTPYCWPGPGGAGPTALPGSIPLTTMAVGGRHVCGVGEDGTAYCWGANENLQLGAPGGPPGPVVVLGQE